MSFGLSLIKYNPLACKREAVVEGSDFSSRWVDLKPLEDLTPYFRERVLATGVDVDESP